MNTLLHDEKGKGGKAHGKKRTKLEKFDQIARSIYFEMKGIRYIATGAGQGTWQRNIFQISPQPEMGKVNGKLTTLPFSTGTEGETWENRSKWLPGVLQEAALESWGFVPVKDSVPLPTGSPPITTITQRKGENWEEYYDRI